jgi:hypothetical protein
MGMRRRAGRSWWAWGIGGGVAAVIIAWLGLCAYRVVQADHELQRATTQAQQLRSQLSSAELTNGGATPQLRQAASEFQQAHGNLTGVLFAPLRVLPVAGRQLKSAVALSAAAGRVASEGSAALNEVHTLLNSPHDTSSKRAAVVHQLAGVVANLDAEVTSVNLGPSKGLFGVLASKRNTFASELTKLQSELGRARGATAALDGLLTGPRTYLVFSANNAEMRAGSGMFLSAGTLTSQGGTLTLGDLTSTSELIFPTAPVPVTGDLARLWGFTEPNQEFRNLALSPQFPANASLAAQMWRARTGKAVDGVLVLDVGALSDLLTATGPVSNDGRSFDSGTVIPYLLNGQYQGLSSGDQDQEGRHEREGDLARSVFAKLAGGGAKLGTLGTALGEAADGRHVLVWAADPTTEAQWVAAGVGGIVGPRDVLLSILNQGANKLDPFLTVTSKMSFTPQGGDTAVIVAVTAENVVPPGQPNYVAGDAGHPPAPGTYQGAIQLDFPGTAGDQEVVNHLPLSAVGPDGASYAMAVPIQLRPGTSTTVTFRFVLGARHGSLQVDPSARFPAASWTVGAQSFDDATAHEVGF